MPAPWIWEQTINPPTDHDEANSSFALNPVADSEFLLTLLVTDLFISQWEKWIGYLVPRRADIFFAYLLSCPFIHHLLAVAVGCPSFHSHIFSLEPAMVKNHIEGVLTH